MLLRICAAFAMLATTGCGPGLPEAEAFAKAQKAAVLSALKDPDARFLVVGVSKHDGALIATCGVVGIRSPGGIEEKRRFIAIPGRPVHVEGPGETYAEGPTAAIWLPMCETQVETIQIQW